jgi:YHS domain-containing protein
MLPTRRVYGIYGFSSRLHQQGGTFMANQIDPVCGMEVNEQDAAGRSEYQDRTFYFCSTSCKEQFDADPRRFITNSIDR